MSKMLIIQHRHKCHLTNVGGSDITMSYDSVTDKITLTLPYEYNT